MDPYRLYQRMMSPQIVTEPVCSQQDVHYPEWSEADVRTPNYEVIREESAEDQDMKMEDDIEYYFCPNQPWRRSA
jgi:hypothetical protein